MDAVMQRVELLLGQNRYAEARGMLMQGLAEEPEHPVLNAFLGYCLRLENKPKEALAPARSAVAMAPEWPFVHYVLALIYDGLDKPKEGLKALDEALRLDPENAGCFGLKAALLMKMDKLPACIEAAELGLRIDPEHTQCRGILTAAKNQLGRHEDVEHLVEESLRRDPEDALAFANKGWSCLRQREPKEAIRYFKEALRLEPDMEWARRGVLEALKARSFLYRGLLAYFFKMGTLPPRLQFAVVFGLFVMYRVAIGIGRSNPALQPYVGVLIIGYIGFFYSTWVGSQLANCTLFFHPLGRLAMTRTEKRQALLLGSVVAAGVAGLVAGRLIPFPLFEVVGLVLIMVTLPLAGTQRAKTDKARRIGLAMTLSILVSGIAGLTILPQLFTVCLVLWIAYIWIVGQYVTRN